MQTKVNLSVIFDLDDTLIKNSIYFKEVKFNISKQMLDYNSVKLNNYSGTNQLIDIFDEFEIKNIKRGKKPGHDNFRISLMQACNEIMQYDFYLYKIYNYIDFQVAQLANKPVELIEGVNDSLSYLMNKGYRLFIVSKGNSKEQEKKIKESGIEHFFEDIVFLSKKESEDYLIFVNEKNLEISNTYMVGNSPKSDINPTKDIGMKTIFIKNESTWKYEHDEILLKEPKTIIIDRIIDIKNIL